MVKIFITFLLVTLASYRLIFLVFQTSSKRIKIAFITAVLIGLVSTHFYELPNYSPAQIVKKSESSKPKKTMPKKKKTKKPLLKKSNLKPLRLRTYPKKEKPKPKPIPQRKIKRQKDNPFLDFG